MDCDVRDLGLAGTGRERIEWAAGEMPLRYPPATLYAGTERGVFKSEDSGAAWSSANTGLSNNAVYALAIDPTTPTTL